MRGDWCYLFVTSLPVDLQKRNPAALFRPVDVIFVASLRLPSEHFKSRTKGWVGLPRHFSLKVFKGLVLDLATNH
jgi:hypothetical protein